ncbi:MAG: amidohydrolase [Acidobacteriota bacterium]
MAMGRRGLIAEIAAEAVEWRREMHRHPQTMYEETFASGLVQEKLKAWGIAHEAGFATTGVVATIEGSGDGPVIAFRADMDALDITEETGLPWASVNPGKMHACGHDGHTATLLALAKYLKETRRFKGKVRLVFQPAEEGGRGAVTMMKDGLLEKYPFDEIYGWHNYPYAPLGDFSICPGYMMAASDSFEVRVTGRGGHAANPHWCDDVIVAASHLVTALQTLVSRVVDPLESAVVSVTTFQAGTGAVNVLPAKVLMRGTVRTFKPELRDMMESKVKGMVEHCAAMFGVKMEIDYWRVIDATFNHAEGTGYSRETVGRLFGAEKMKVQVPVMGGEDFGSFLEKAAGAFVFLGQGEADRDSVHNQGLHTSRYDFNDAVIPMAVEYFAELAETRLG